MMVVGWKRVVLLAMLAWMGHVLAEDVIASTGSRGSRLKHIKYPAPNAVEIPTGRSFRMSEIGGRMVRNPAMPKLETRARVVNGNFVSDIATFPATVILALLRQQVFLSICTGTLVDDNIVLTAAHCSILTSNANQQSGGEGLLVVCAGGLDFITEREDYTCSLVEEGYVPGTYVATEVFDGNDLGLMKLSTNLTEVEGVEASKVSFEKQLHGTLTQTVGYGATSYTGARGVTSPLNHVDGLIVDSDRCTILSWSRHYNTTEVVCIDGDYDGSGGASCSGDSGGPTYVQGSTPEDNYVVGVVSWGRGSRTARCMRRSESVNSALHSTAHKEFLMDAMELLGGTWTEIEDPPGLTCEGRVGLCEALPGDASCLNDEGADLMTCCPTAKAQLSCTKIVAEECEDVELMEATDALLDKYEERCTPQYRCGDDDILQCDYLIPGSCRGRFPAADNNLLDPTVTCCDAKLNAEACLKVLLEGTCEGSELVQNALEGISSSFEASELCEEYECSATRFENCDPEDLRDLPCTEVLNGDIFINFEQANALCCERTAANVQCLRSALESCPTRQQLINKYLGPAEELLEAGSCQDNSECDPQFCTALFSTYCDDSVTYYGDEYLTRYFYSLPNYPTGLLEDDEAWLSAFCCYQYIAAGQCLAKRKDSCGEDYEEAFSAAEEELEQFAPAEGECEEDLCDPSRCALEAFDPGYSAFGIPDDGCAELHVERRCLIKLLNSCNDKDNAIANAIEATLDALEGTDCDPLECDIRAARCYVQSYLSSCPTPIAELAPGGTDTVLCCGSAVYARACLLKVSEECPTELMVGVLFGLLEEVAPFETCQDVICTGAYCLLPLNDANCENISEIEDPLESAACCDTVNTARRCMSFTMNFTCVDPEADERQSLFEELTNKYADEECREVSCADGINDCTAALTESCPDGYSNECCSEAALAKDCLARLSVDCSDVPEVVEQIEMKMDEIENDILEPFCGPCYDLCGEWDCVLSKTGKPFCANCAGFLKPDGNGTDAECCAYDEEKMMCATVLKSQQPGICRISDDLFYINQDGDRTEVTGITYNYACMDIFAMRRLDLACQVRVNKKPVCTFIDDSS